MRAVSRVAIVLVASALIVYASEGPARAVLVTKIDGTWREVPIQSQVAIQLLADLAAG